MASPTDDPTLTAIPEAAVVVEDEPRCDACSAALPPIDDDEDAFSVPGAGVYMWTRGSEVRFEKAPLCPSCAAAIGVTALTRWESEEEEG